jgi:NAD(P)-dependent dehydrogenase (short-subunit alcohol dehydrogenase family)
MARSCDIGDREQVREAVDFVIRERGRVDVLINNAGVLHVGPFEDSSDGIMQENLGVYLWGPLFLIRAVAPHMRRQGRGRIVNITSIAGVAAIPHLAAYSAAKSAETGLSDAVRAELARDNIRVTTVIPALLRTGSYEAAWYTGRHAGEYAWFGLSGAMPLLASNAEKAAHRIVEACRYGDPVLVLSLKARLLRLMNTLLPGTTAALMKLAARALPSPVREPGSPPKQGRHSRPGGATASGIDSFGQKAARRNLEQKSSVR